MSLNLKKGQKISLSKENAGLSELVVGLGWDEVSQKKGLFGGRQRAIDCDAFALLLSNGRLAAKSDIVYYANKHHYSESVIHTGDNLTGAGEGDDEQIIVKLNELPAQYDRVVIGVNIFVVLTLNKFFKPLNITYIIKQKIKIPNSEDVLFFLISLIFSKGL